MDFDIICFSLHFSGENVALNMHYFVCQFPFCNNSDKLWGPLEGNGGKQLAIV